MPAVTSSGRPTDLGAIVGEVARKARRPDRDVVITGDETGRGGRRPGVADEARLDPRRQRACVTGQARSRSSSRPIRPRWRAALTIADRGPGIPPGDEQRIFERFHRADPARSGEGAGLGLAIATAIVAAHDGSLTAANRDEGGAAFRVELPLLVG